MTATTGFWRSIEAIHDVVYFAPDVKERYEAIGLKGYWMGYVASRSAALGTPPPELVIATFHGFAPTMVRRSLPDAWSLATRDQILTTRFTLARDALAPALKDADTAALAQQLVAIVDGLNLAGKPLAAAHAAVPRPDDAAGLLWWAATVIREYRGDCHLAVLTAAGLDGADSNALAVAAGLASDDQRMFRGWTEDEWSLAVDRLRTRGWVDAEGEITEAGRSARQQIEDTTDRVCNAGFDQEATAHKITVEASLLELARAVVASGAITYPIPSGVKSP